MSGTKEKDIYMIWSAFPDFNDWEADLREEYPEMDEDELYSRMYEVNNAYLDDERVNLGGITYSVPIIIIATIQKWDGLYYGYAEEKSGKVSNCLSSEYDAEWYVTKDGEFCCNDHHHDGTNHYTYRVWKRDTTEEQRDDLTEKLYEHKATQADIDAVTDKIGPDIAKVYGWKLTMEKEPEPDREK